MTRETGRPSTFDTESLIPKWPWLLHQIGDVAVRGPPRGAVLGLYVALVDRPGAELALNDDVRLLKAFVDVSQLELVMGGYVGAPRRLAAESGGGDVVVEDGRVCRHGRLHVGHGGHNVVAHLYERQGLLGHVGAGGGDGGDGVALVQHLVRGEDVVADVLHAGEDVLTDLCQRIGHLCQVGRRGDRPDVWVGLGLAGVDGRDAGVGVGAAQHLAVQHPLEPHVGAVERLAGDLVHSVVPDRTRADDFVALRGLGYGRHAASNQSDIGSGAGCAAGV